jgi:hypothetical protein
MRTYDVEKDWVAHGLRCVAITGQVMGHRCGYVGLPKGHPLHGVGYGEGSPLLREMWQDRQNDPVDDDTPVIPLFCHMFKGGNPDPTPDITFRVHGGITYAGGGDDYPVPSDGLWWYGFDCGHAGDEPDPELQSPRARAIYAGVSRTGVVRDLAFVATECERLAQQLAAMTTEAE